MRKLFSDLLQAPRRFFYDLLEKPRRFFRDLAQPARRFFRDLVQHTRRKFCDLAKPAPGPTPQFESAEFYGSQYHKWAAQFFRDNLWRALPQEEVDDLLQDVYFKYARCVELYVRGKCTCRGPAHLMSIFKKACKNMLTDQSRKKQRCPERYQNSVVDPEMYLDNSLLTAIGLSDMGSDLQVQEYQHALQNL